jgi:hypothetical protein
VLVNAASFFEAPGVVDRGGSALLHGCILAMIYTIIFVDLTSCVLQ